MPELRELEPDGFAPLQQLWRRHRRSGFVVVDEGRKVKRPFKGRF
jgi:hypothetical protein